MKTWMLIAFCFLAVNMSFAQKFGHMNVGNLLEIMPEVEKADQELAAQQQKLESALKARMEKFQKEYAALVQRVNSGDMTPIQIQTEEAKFKAEGEAIQKEEQTLIITMQNKRAELLKPILEKVDSAIQAIGKEEGYTMIFDVSSGAMLFAPDSQDITAKVKARLGIQ